MKYKLIKKFKNSGLRNGELIWEDQKIKTPVFMPVGTVGAVKGISPHELKSLGYNLILGNTYHLHLRPGEKLVKKMGGLRKFINWSGKILTDSGGYQVFSLSNKNYVGSESLVKIKSDGVEFRSYLDGSKHFFTPEKVVQIQLDLGSDIIMPLDVCPSGTASNKEIKKAVEITIKWAKRSKEYFDKKIAKISSLKRPVQNFLSQEKPALFAIVQGGLDKKLRQYCARELVKLNFNGYAVGGLAVDPETRGMWQVVEQMGKILPENKPRYLMGVGTPEDLYRAINFGMDMFDCVLPTRTARHGSAYIYKDKGKYQTLDFRKSLHKSSTQVLDPNCSCPACAGKFTRSYLHHLVKEKEMLGIRLLTLHNLAQYQRVVQETQK